MSERLSGFEGAVRRIGAQAHFNGTTSSAPRYAEQRAAATEFVLAEYQQDIPHRCSTKIDEGVSVESVQQHVRTMLGIEGLLELRNKPVARAQCPH